MWQQVQQRQRRWLQQQQQQQWRRQQQRQQWHGGERGQVGVAFVVALTGCGLPSSLRPERSVLAPLLSPAGLGVLQEGGNAEDAALITLLPMFYLSPVCRAGGASRGRQCSGCCHSKCAVPGGAQPHGIRAGRRPLPAHTVGGWLNGWACGWVGGWVGGQSACAADAEGKHVAARDRQARGWQACTEGVMFAQLELWARHGVLQAAQRHGRGH